MLALVTRDIDSYEATNLDTKHVSSNVMRPLTISDITSRSSEFRLELQTSPRHNGILLISSPHQVTELTHTREPNRVPMTSRPSVPRKGKPPIPLPARIKEMIMVQYPKRVHALDFGMRTLLPIKPPEIDTFIFEWVMEEFQVFIKEFLVGTFEWDWLIISGFMKMEMRWDLRHPWKNPVRGLYTLLRMVSRMPVHHLLGEC